MPTFQPVSGRRIAEGVAEQIKDNILSGELSVGDRLPPEREFAKLLNTSPQVLREALHSLEASGLVVIRKGATGGTFVSRPTSSLVSDSLSTLLRFGHTTLDHLTEARMALEPEAASLASRRRTDEVIAALRANIAESRDAALSAQRRRVANLEFHRQIAEITGNPIIIAGVGAVMDNLIYNISKSTLESSVIDSTQDYHVRITDALEAGDSASAYLLMRAHIKQIQDSLKSSSHDCGCGD